MQADDDMQALQDYVDKEYGGTSAGRSVASRALEMLRTERANCDLASKHRLSAIQFRDLRQQLDMLRTTVEQLAETVQKISKAEAT